MNYRIHKEPLQGRMFAKPIGMDLRRKWLTWAVRGLLVAVNNPLGIITVIIFIGWSMLFVMAFGDCPEVIFKMD